MNTTYAEAPLVFRANPSDPRGEGYYMYVDQKWAESPSGEPFEEQLHPYWSTDLDSGNWTPIDWTQKLDYELALGVMRHGSVIALTTAENAGLRGADLTSVSIEEVPTKLIYSLGEELEVSGLRVSATYSDGMVDDELFQGYSSYTLSGFDSEKPSEKTVTVSYAVVDVTMEAYFNVQVRKRCARAIQ